MSTPIHTALQELVDRAAQEAGIPGAAAAVVFDGDELVVTTGVTSVDAPAPVTDTTLFMIGSTTKTLTATAVLALVDEGRLALDGRVADVLPDVALADPGARATLTIRHLLTHSGGFEGDIADDESDWGEDALAKGVAGYGSLTQHVPPGAGFSYSNAGFRLLGRILEVVEGESYDEVIRRRILEPLGMGDSLFLPWEVFSRPHAVGHEVDEKGARVAHTWGLGRSALPEGGLLSSIADQVRYLRFHLEGAAAGTPPVSPEVRLGMQRPALEAAPPFAAVGMPWLLVPRSGRTAVTHGGNIAGVQRSTFLMLPEEGLGITVLANSGGGGALGAAVEDWCLQHLLGLAPAPAHTVVTRSAADLEPYRGRYDGGTWGVELTPEEGMLRATFFFAAHLAHDAHQLPPPMLLSFTGDGEEVVLPQAPDTIFGRFSRGSSGEVAVLYAQGRMLPRSAS